MSDLRCAACGMPAHRYGRNEGTERFDPMACINTLRGEVERLEKATRLVADPNIEAAYRVADNILVIKGHGAWLAPHDVAAVVTAALTPGDTE